VLAVLRHLVCERWRSPNTGTQGDASAHGSTDAAADTQAHTGADSTADGRTDARAHSSSDAAADPEANSSADAAADREAHSNADTVADGSPGAHFDSGTCAGSNTQCSGEPAVLLGIRVFGRQVWLVLGWLVGAGRRVVCSFRGELLAMLRCLVLRQRGAKSHTEPARKRRSMPAVLWP